MTAYVLAISSLETGRRLGAALVCPEARYASIAWQGGTRIIRVFLPAPDWKVILSEIGEHLPPGPLPASSPLVRALQLDNDVVVQYASIEPIGAAVDLITAAALDTRLVAEVAAPKLVLEQQP